MNDVQLLREFRDRLAELGASGIELAAYDAMLERVAPVIEARERKRDKDRSRGSRASPVRQSRDSRTSTARQSHEGRTSSARNSYDPPPAPPLSLNSPGKTRKKEARAPEGTVVRQSRDSRTTIDRLDLEEVWSEIRRIHGLGRYRVPMSEQHLADDALDWARDEHGEQAMQALRVSLEGFAEHSKAGGFRAWEFRAWASDPGRWHAWEPVIDHDVAAPHEVHEEEARRQRKYDFMEGG